MLHKGSFKFLTAKDYLYMFYFYIYTLSLNQVQALALSDSDHRSISWNTHPSTKASAQGPHIHKEMSGMSKVINLKIFDCFITEFKMSLHNNLLELNQTLGSTLP